MSKKIFVSSSLLIAMMLFGITSCGIQKMKNLANCEFKLNKVDRINVAGVSLNPSGKTNLSFADLLKISSAFSNKKIPVDVNALLDIKNPNSGAAKMSKFDWKLKLKDKLVASGTVPDQISVAGNSQATTSLATDFDLYDSMGEFSLEELKSGVSNAFDTEGNPKDLKIFLKPYMSVAGINIPYPGFIEISKHFKSK